MVHRFALLLVVLLAACDSGQPVAPVLPSFVGTWAPETEGQTTLIKSQVQQSVPDFSAQASGGVRIQGEVRGDFQYVSSINRVRGEFVYLTLVASPTAETTPILVLTDINGSVTADLNWAYSDGSREYFRGAFPAGVGAVTFTNGSITVPTLTLVSEGASSRTVQLGGTASFPTVSLAANEESTLRITERPITDWQPIRFAEDGAYFQGSERVGTWTADGDDHVIVSYGGSVQIRYEHAVRGGTLSLTNSPEFGCTGECVQNEEANLFAQPGSFGSVRYVNTTKWGRASG